jgi:hypothetical protein
VTIYSIFARETPADIEAVPDRFSWFAALLPPIYALVHRLWATFAVYIVAVVLLAIAGRAIGGDSATWLYVIGALLFGFEAQALRRGALRRRGYAYRGEWIASAEEQAAQGWLIRASRP